MRKLLFNPGPTNVNIEVKQALITENHSHRDEEFLDVFERVCSNLVKICYGEQTHSAIPFVASGTGANEAILSSVSGNLLFIENGRYSKRLIDIASKYKHNIKVVHFDPLTSVDLNQIKEILEQDKEIKYIVAVHHETTTSLMIPIKKLGELSHQFNTPLIIDGISSIGAHDFNVSRDNIAFCSVSANKCLESIPGISFVIASNLELNKHKGHAQTFYFDLYRQWQYTLKNRLPFTAAIQLFFSLDVALKRLLDETVEGRAKRYKSLKTYLKDRLKPLGIESFNIPEEFCSNILSLFHLPKGVDLILLSDKMKERGIIIYTDLDTAQRGQFFLATMGDLIKGEIDYFIENFQLALNELGFQQLNTVFFKKRFKMDKICNQRGLILAAGLGSRLGDLTHTIPKCLVPVNGIPILENCIRSLNELGIADITIVVGYKKELVNDFIKQKFSNLSIELVENKEYDNTGTAYSLLLGLERKDYGSEVVIIEGDVFFEPDLLRVLLNNSKKINKTSISIYDPSLSGTFVELDTNKYIRSWVHESRRPENFMVEKAFKTINITLFHPHSLSLLISSLKSTLVEHRKRSPLEYAFHDFIQISRLGIQGVEAENMKWFEIDTQEDLAIANNIFQDIIVGG